MPIPAGWGPVIAPKELQRPASGRKEALLRSPGAGVPAAAFGWLPAGRTRAAGRQGRHVPLLGESSKLISMLV